MVMKKDSKDASEAFQTRTEEAGSQVSLSFFISLKRPVIGVFYLPDLSGS